MGEARREEFVGRRGRERVEGGEERWRGRSADHQHDE
jgi:hypothetical protein